MFHTVTILHQLIDFIKEKGSQRYELVNVLDDSATALHFLDK